MKEKTKAELLAELNEELENKIKLLKEENAKLTNEIRVAKSNVSRVEANTYKLDTFDKLVEERDELAKQVANQSNQLNIQDKQIEILLNGLNSVNNAIGRFFENTNYVLALAKDNYDNVFGTIQNQLNNLIPKEQGGSE